MRTNCDMCRTKIEDGEKSLSKVVQEISQNHHKIIEDWCKAYLAQLYEEGYEIKPGCFTLNEQVPTYNINQNCMVKKYWFEIGTPHFDNENEWISVDDRLPEDEVILLHPFKRIDGTDEFIIFVGYLDEFEDVWICGWSGMLPPCKNNYTQSFIDKNFRLKKSDVTHWMKLPELPKGKDERVD